MGLKYVQTLTFYQAGSGNIVGATTVTLTSFSDIYGNVLTMTDFGDKGYGTCESDTTNEEAFTFTGVTANANGTYTLTGVKTALAKSPYTETSALIRQHAGGSKVVITDNVAFWNTFANKQNDETITGQWTFNSFPITPSNSDASTTVKGVTKLSVAPASASNPIAVGTNDTRIPIAFAVDSSGTDAYAVTPSPAVTALVQGMSLTFQAGTANTGAATLNVSGLGAVSIFKFGGTVFPLQTGDILVNQEVTVVYDGARWQMTSLTSPQPPVVNVYTSGGTWTKPSNLRYIIVEVQAGGGAGGGSAATNQNGSGGGAGGYSRELLLAASLGATETYAVGAGGTGVSGGTGNTGGTSSFGTSPYLTATGGAGGGPGGSGGLGGVGSNGNLNLVGQGGGALSTTNSGAGGSSYLGGGGASQSSVTSGVVGGVYGGGGSGGRTTSGADQTGGAGGAGVVIVTEFY